MKIASYCVMSIAFFCATSVSAADDPLAKPHVGEVRAMAISLNTGDAVAELHHEGWLRAQGQLLSAREFPELYQALGRTWTADDVFDDRFAIPEIFDRSQRIVSSDNPFGVLGPGDLLTSGRARKSWLRHNVMSYWIYAGRPVNEDMKNLNTRR